MTLSPDDLGAVLGSRQSQQVGEDLPLVAQPVERDLHDGHLPLDGGGEVVPIADPFARGLFEAFGHLNVTLRDAVGAVKR